MKVDAWGLVFGAGSLIVAALVGADIIGSAWSTLALVLAVLTVAQVTS